MSRMTFSTRSGDEVEIRGAERHYLGYLIWKITSGFLPTEIPDIASFLPADHYLQTGIERHREKEILCPSYEVAASEKQILRDFETVTRVGFDLKVRTREGLVDFWYLQLNTALHVGSAPIRLAAFIHSQCEIHGWVAGKNRAWMADVIEDGLGSKIFRPNMGWEDLIRLLRRSKTGAVVSEYSVTDSFNWKKLSLSACPEWTPKGFEEDYFGSNLSLLDYKELTPTPVTAEIQA